MTHTPHTCPLCHETGGTIIWRNEQLRVIRTDDEHHPGFTRVIWQDHVTEMTQLSPSARQRLMETVWRVEQAQRDWLEPDKINLAQFGNMVPHLHWHVIPRWAQDSHFPEAIWAPAPHRSAAQEADWQQRKAQIVSLLPAYWAGLQESLQRSNVGVSPDT